MGQSPFTIEFECEPLVFAISNGEDMLEALFTPRRYGEEAEDAVYSGEGVNVYGDGAESRYARPYFRDGILREVFGFTNDDGTGAPREIIP